MVYALYAAPRYACGRYERRNRNYPKQDDSETGSLSPDLAKRLVHDLIEEVKPFSSFTRKWIAKSAESKKWLD